MESSGEEDEEGSLDELNSKNKSNDEQQESYFKTGPEKETNMEANTVPPSVGVSSSGRNVMEGFDESVEEPKKEKSEESTNKSEQITKINKNNTETEEATSMKADMEAIDIEAQSGLLNHVVGSHAKEGVASKRMEEEANKVDELESTSKK